MALFLVKWEKRGEMGSMIYIIMGPSGSGKTEVGEYLKSIGIKELVSHTTRAPRTGEKDGEAYHFVDEQSFLDVDKVEGSMYAGNRYGVSREEVERKTSEGDVFAVTDINGARAFSALYKEDVRIIYISASPKILRKRMKKRGDSRKAIRKRFQNYINNRETLNRFFSDIIIDNSYSRRTLIRFVNHAIKVIK
ncbi:MAG TPA: guanylate kinase [Clostridiaceae bacterium]|nr:guanylate kinase [Clostridiaceae bacterium]